MILGKIYIIIFTDGTSYVGSTTKPYLSQRISQHKEQKLSINGFTQEVSIRINTMKYYYEILKEDLFFNKYDLLYWERILTELTPNTLNKRRCWRTTEEEEEQIKTTKKNVDKNYRQKNLNEIREKQNRKFICDCGKQYTHSNKSRHLKSQFHKNYLLNKSS